MKHSTDDWQNGGFGIYVHWPFCQAKCPYCDFNSHVSRSIDHARWGRAYLTELERLRAMTGERAVRSVFFGGGTPSLMPPDLVGQILERISALWPQGNDLEVTLEANPTSVEAARFLGFRDAGVNRVSVGIQALNDTDLQRLGRLHSVAEARKAFDLARSIFSRASFDLIYARQHQTLEDWRAELTKALKMEAGHLSLYQLTIEDGTAFGDRYQRGKLGGLPEDDTSADMFLLTQEMCAAAGLPAYEISNHARDTHEGRHNLVYWRYGDYLGVGPGAHGRLTLSGTRWACQSARMPNAWLEQVESTGSGEMPRQALSSEDQAAEYLMMSLRLREGSSLSRYQALAGAPLNREKLAELLESGHIWLQNDRIGTTNEGRVVLNAVLRQLL
ncbi:radical SAM family heme chaperone HemW [Pararhodobacter sp.]|uniref:radical SAM family heme chaperone HemW n=1 Tax=Pararhodobacter sp. TaxID=2127056 RepID=UPI002FDD6ED1